MGLFRMLSGWVRLRYVSADIGSVLSEFEKQNITIYDVHTVDPLTLEFTVHQINLKRIEQMADRRSERLTVTGRKGLFWSLPYLLVRPILLGGILLILTIAVMLPGRILFVSVEGNSRIPSREILEAASQAGLDFGTVRRDIRSEQIKNQLLDAIPELKWAGVNSYGSRAVITVRERDDGKTQTEAVPVRHIVAGRDGVIVASTVTDGSGACNVGQAVKTGDILISGYTDCGISIRAGVAKGQILAQTSRDLTVVTPVSILNRTDTGDERVLFSLIIGKKRINFYKGSGISGGTCVKMYSEYVLQLPGGFELPLCLVRAHILDCSLVNNPVDDPDAELRSFADGYLSEQMVSGTVIQGEEAVLQSDTLWYLEGHYACIEDIGVEQEEKIGDLHGKADGADRECGSGG